MSGPESWAAWMAAAQKGDEEAYRRLLEAIRPVVFRYLRRRLPTNEAAEDVSQDVLLTIHRVRHSYEPERPFEPWMYAIAKSRLIDHLRREKRMKNWLVAVDILPDVAGEAPVGPGSDKLQAAIDALPPTQREAFTLLKIDGLTTKDAAVRAGVSLTALKVRAHRAYVALKRALASESE